MKFPKPLGNPAVNIKRAAYAMATEDGQSAEINMYGDIYEQHPTDWWGDPIEGQFITLDQFLADLQEIAGCKEITIRMNSYGGDAGVSNTIHNRLRELSRAGAKLVCVVDGVAMSGGSLIMCACDTVRVNPSSLIMIHKCWQFIWGGYNADELRAQAAQQDAWDKMQVEIYKRKTGMDADELLAMMAETTCMTGREAMEKSFADELIEDAEPLDIAASADGRSLFVRGRTMHMAPGMFVPDSIPTVKPEASAAVETNKNQPAMTGSQEGGQKPMAKNLDELRQEYPQLTAQLEAEAKAAAVPAADAISAAVQAEQARLQEIDTVAHLFSDDLVQEAKYGDKACSAQELAYRAAQAAAQQGKKFLVDLEADAKASGAQNVGAVPPAGEEGKEDPIAQARADAKAFNESKKEVR